MAIFQPFFKNLSSSQFDNINDNFHNSSLKFYKSAQILIYVLQRKSKGEYV